MTSLLKKPEPTAARRFGLLELDSDLLRSNLNRKGFTVRHHLAAHELFTLPRLIQLSRILPEQDVEYNVGSLPINMDPSATPRNGLSIEETIQRIEECGSWMVMKFVERDPEYREIMDRCLDEVQAFIEPLGWRMRQREAFIFISSPASVTPYHFDPEYNFLLQIRGNKTVHVFPRSVVTEEELEQRFSFLHRNLPFNEEVQKTASAFILQPGTGVHVPVAAPHWVKNGDNVSISFSITFRTSESEKEAALYRLNAQLRARGFRPTPVHRSPILDRFKFLIYHGIRFALKPVKLLRSLIPSYPPDKP